MPIAVAAKYMALELKQPSIVLRIRVLRAVVDPKLLYELVGDILLLNGKMSRDFLFVEMLDVEFGLPSVHCVWQMLFCSRHTYTVL